MTSLFYSQPIKWPLMAWTFAVLAGVGAPFAALLMLAGEPDTVHPIKAIAPLLALGLMGMGMIASAAAGRFWTGFALALICGAVLVLALQALGSPGLSSIAATGFVFCIASLSFAARGALFAKSGGGRGWWIALAVVAGEAAIIATAWAEPGAIPQWLLVLLPAQWASIAIEASITGMGWQVAGAALVALGGTAAATMLVAKLWPARWTYSVMFTAWLALSALVWWSGFGGLGESAKDDNQDKVRTSLLVLVPETQP